MGPALTAGPGSPPSRKEPPPKKSLLLSRRRGFVWLTVAFGLGLAGGLTPAAQAAPGVPPSDGSSYPVGYLPDGQDWSAVNDADYPPSPLMGDRPQFDLRSDRDVPAVRNQGPYGDCWAFAATGSAMSGLSRLGNDATALSPTHLDYSVYNEMGIMNWKSALGATIPTHPLNDGGNDVLASSAWAKHYGAQTEAVYPYSNAATVLGLDQVRTSAYHQRDAWVFPRGLDSQGQIDEDNVTAIKDAVYNYGALSVSYYADSGQASERLSTIYNPAHVAVYNYPGNSNNPGNQADHAVLLIGWADTFPASYFSTTPPGPGAWLMQNSWGVKAGDGGYFWLSYYDATATEPWFFNLVPATTDDVQNVYFLDDGPPINRVSLAAPTGYEANILQIPQGAKEQSLKAVSIFVGTPHTAYEVSVYIDPTTTPTSGTQIDVSSGDGKSVTGTVANAGWNRINLDLPVILDPGQKFSVVVKVSVDTGRATAYQESATPVRTMDGSSTLWAAQALVTSQSGQSFISSTGVSWSDVGANNQGNLAIKALTADTTKVDVNILLQPVIKMLLAFLTQLLMIFPNISV